MSREQDSYESFRAYYWQDDRRISANYAIKLREESGDPRIGDCYCHKKCRERGEAAKRFPRKVDHLGKRNHFWKGPGQGNSSKDCEIRTRVRRLKEDSGRNNHYDNFLSDLIFHLTGSGSVLQLLEIGESPIDEYDILSSEVPRVRSSSTPDIILRHGSSTVRDKTYVYVINTSRNRTCYDPPHRTELNTIVIRITHWSSDQIADFGTFGTRKFREEWGFLEGRIRKDAEEREAELIAEVCGYRDRVRTLIEKGKMSGAILASWDSGENDQDAKEKFLGLLPVIEAGEKELRDEEEERQRLINEAIMEELEKQRIAQEAEEAARVAAEEEAARVAAEEEARKIEGIYRRRREFQGETTRRHGLLDQNHSLAKELQLLTADFDGYGYNELVDFCIKFPHARRQFHNTNLRKIVRDYFTPGFPISPEEFLSSVLGTGIFGFSEHPGLKSFEEINEFLSTEIQSSKERIISAKLTHLKEEYEELFGVETPEDLIEKFIASRYEVVTRDAYYSRSFSARAYVRGTSDLEDVIIEKRTEVRNRNLADKRAKDIEDLCDSLESHIGRSRELDFPKLEDTLKAMESVSRFSRQIIRQRDDSAEGSEGEVLTTALLCDEHNFSDLTAQLWEELGGSPPDVTSIHLVDVSSYGNPNAYRKLAPAGLDSVTKLEQILRKCADNLNEANEKLQFKRSRDMKWVREKRKTKTNKKGSDQKENPNSIRCPECGHTRIHKKKRLPDCGPCATKRRKNVRMERANR